MSMFKRAYKAVQRFVMRHSAQRLGSNWLLPRIEMDYAARVGDGTESSIIMAVVGWIARTFPEAPLQVVRIDSDGQRQVQVAHRMIALLEIPNGAYSGVLLWMATLLDWLTDGNAYWIKVRNGLGAPIELWWVPQATIRPCWPADGSEFISHYEYNPDGVQWSPIPCSSVIHFRYGMDPSNPRKGLSPLRSVLREVFTDDEAARFTAALLKNMGVPGVVISPDNDDIANTDIDAETIKAKFIEKFSGTHRGEPLILSSRVRVTALSFNPQQMDLKTLRRLPEERVTAVFGLPAIVAGLGAGLDRSTFANFKEAREAAYESNIIPTQRLFAAELKTQLLPDFIGAAMGYDLQWDLSQVRVLQEDEDSKQTRNRANFRAGIITLNQALAHIGEQPDPAGDYYLRPSSMVAQPFGEMPEAPELPELPDLPEMLAAPMLTPPADEPQALPVDDELPDEPPAKGAKASGTRLVRDLRRDEQRLVAAFAADADKVFAELGNLVRVHVAKAGDGASESKLGINDIINTIWTAGEMLTIDVPVDASKALFLELYKAHFSHILTTTYGTVATNLGLSASFNLPDYRARELIRGWVTRKGLADVEAQTRDAVMQALTDGRVAGEGVEDLALRIKGMVEGRQMYPGIYQRTYAEYIDLQYSVADATRFADEAARMYRAETIARTETKLAQNKSTLAAYIDSEVVEGVIVYDGTDWDDACREANGQTWTFEQALENPLQHVNCVRSFAPNVRRTVI